MLIITEFHLVKHELRLRRQETDAKTPLGMETAAEDMDHLLIQITEDGRRAWSM